MMYENEISILRIPTGFLEMAGVPSRYIRFITLQSDTLNIILPTYNMYNKPE